MTETATATREISRNTVLTLVVPVIAIAAKSILAVLTPMSFDFINIADWARLAFEGEVFQGPYTFSVNLMSIPYRFWLLLPVDHNWIYSDYSFIPSSSGYLLVFLFKLPLLVFDIFTCILIYRMVSFLSADRRIPVIAALIWLLNPYLTIGIEMDGTIDIVSTCLVVFATYMFIRSRYLFSGASLAVASMARLYPIALFPFYAALLWKNRGIRGAAVMIISYVAPIALIAVPVLMMYGAGKVMFVDYQLYDVQPTIYNVFRETAFWFYGFMPGVASSSGIMISSVVTALTIFAMLILMKKNTDTLMVLDSTLLVFLTYFGLSHFNRFYTIWVIPFLTVDLALKWRDIHGKVYKVFYVLFFVTAFLYNSAYWWFESMFFFQEYPPDVYLLVQSLKDTLLFGGLGTTFVQSIFAGTCIVYAVLIAISVMHRQTSILSGT